MRKSRKHRDRDRIVLMAGRATEIECRRRKIKCWEKITPSGYRFTPQAKKIFDKTFDRLESVISEFLSGR